MRAHWLLGAAYRLAGEWEPAEHHLQEAFARCRRLDMVTQDVPILVEVAELHLDMAAERSARPGTSPVRDAERLLEEALVLTARGDDVLQAAEVRLALARLAVVREDAEALRAHAAHARRLAACDGPPELTYRAVYDAASALLSATPCSSTR